MSTPAAVSPPKGLLEILKAVSGLTTGWTFAVGHLQPMPDKQVVLRNASGPSGEVLVAQDYPGVQVLVRGAPQEYEEAWAKAFAVKEALLAHPSHPSEYAALASCTMRGDITDLGWDDKDRPIFSLNFQLIVSYTVSGYRDQ